MSEGETEASKEEDEAKIEDESYEFLSEWVRKRLYLPEMTEEIWGEDHDLIVNEFMSHPTARGMICYIDGAGPVNIILERY